MAHRRFSTSSARGPTAFLSSPRMLKHRPYYPSLRSRAIVMFTITFIAFVSCTIIFRSWTSSSLPRLHSYQDLYPSSRAFRYDSGVDPRRTQAAYAAERVKAPGYSFARHPTEELGVLVGFLTAFSSNSMPLTIDPQAHIDPELVLGFNTRTESDEVVAEVQNIVADTWARNPVVIFSELHTTAAPASREAKKIVEALALNPRPTVFEVDDRDDAEVLKPLLSRLTGHQGLPLVLIGGEPLGSLAELRAANGTGSLRNMVASAGAVIDGDKRKKRKH